MQKPNPVIKNYIYSTEKRILKEYPPLKPIEISLYHSPSGQSKDYFFLFRLRK